MPTLEFVLLMVATHLAWLKCYTIVNGDQYVMITGRMMMLMWPVDNWDSCHMVNAISTSGRIISMK